MKQNPNLFCDALRERGGNVVIFVGGLLLVGFCLKWWGGKREGASKRVGVVLSFDLRFDLKDRKRDREKETGDDRGCHPICMCSW